MCLRAGKAAVLYLFEDSTLDTDRRELLKADRPVAAQPQVFDVLAFLIANRGRVVSKDQIIEAVWEGRVVSESTLTSRINAARSAVGDSGEAQRLIKTASRKGFRFIGTVRETAATEKPAPSPLAGVLLPIATSALDSRPPRLSIVVLPFVNLDSDPEQEYFADGVTDSLTTDLSRISGAVVIGRGTAFTYKAKAVDLKQIGRDLNVRYVLEGSIQRSGNRMRVNAQLVDTESGNRLWAERFDKAVAELFEMQDEIVARLANTLNAQLIFAEARRAERAPSPDSMDLYFQGMSAINRGHTPSNLAEARKLFERALALDPGNVDAMLGVALTGVLVAGTHTSDDRAALLTAAETLAIKALSIAPEKAWGHYCLGIVQIYTSRAVQGIAAFERALAIDRNLADAHAMIGLAKIFVGCGEETAGHVEDALRLSPRDTSVYYWEAFKGIANVFLGKDEEAASQLRRAIEINRNHQPTRFYLAVALAGLGRLDEARNAAKEGLAFDPTFTIRRYRGDAPSDNPVFLAGRRRVYEMMRRAGIPEG